VYGSLRSLIGGGATVVLVEQDLSRALSVAGRVVCLLEGRVVLSSATSRVTREQVTEAYFGLSRTGSGGSA
jgi:branched-chain amino acid transport system ATP-binding protein